MEEGRIQQQHNFSIIIGVDWLHMHSLPSSVLHSLAGLHGPFTNLKRSATVLTGLLVPLMPFIYVNRLAAVPITCMRTLKLRRESQEISYIIELGQSERVIVDG